MIGHICDLPNILEVARIIGIVITIIKIVVPILLIISVMIDLVRAVTTSELNKISKSSVTKVIAAILIFLIPTFVSLIADVAGISSEYEKCLKDVDKASIEKTYIDQMDTLINKAEESLSIMDYSSAYSYLSFIKDAEKRKEYEEKLKEIKEKIDEQNKKVNTNSSLVSSGLGREIVPSQGLIIACNWVLNQELVNIRLETCQQEEYRYKQPELDLPGGATIGSTKDVAKKTITLYDYSLGVFFGEENILVSPQSRYAFTIIYKTVFLRSRAYNAMSRGIDPLTGHEIRYSAGNCNQNYKERQRKSKYDSGKYKTELDDARETTKYLILANTNGEVTDARYHSYTGIEQQITRDGKAGMEFTQIIEDIKSGNDDSYAYRNAKVYDCRNLYEDGTIEYLVGKK